MAQWLDLLTTTPNLSYGQYGNMIPVNAISPFKPGFGQIPDAFVGRDREQYKFREHLNNLNENTEAIPLVTLISPRGFGKTALLRWTKNEIKTNYPRVREITISPSEAENTIELMQGWIDPGWMEKMASYLETKFQWKPASALPLSTTTSIELSYKSGKEKLKTVDKLTKILGEQFKNKPAAIFLDEAHTLSCRNMKEFIYAMQELSGTAPVQCYMAGTPGLAQTLNKTNSTYWTRANKNTPGLLEKEETKAGFEIPLKKYVDINDKALEVILDKTQNYPYFVQLWGDECFRYAKKNRLPRIEEKHIADIEKEVWLEQSGFYETRYREIEEPGLYEISIALAKEFRKQRVMNEGMLDYLLEKHTSGKDADRKETKERLTALGYIWQGNPAEKTEYHPTVPSIMNYILDHDKKRKAGRPDRPGIE